MREEKISRRVCDEIAGELRDMAAWLAAGQLTPEQFRVALLALEAAKVQRHGLALHGELTSRGRAHFELRVALDDRLCATLDYDSGSQALAIEHLGG